MDVILRVIAEPDRIALQRIFQPIADRLAGIVSCYGLARQALCCALMMQAVSMVLMLATMPKIVWFGSLLLLGIEGVVASRCFKVIKARERQATNGLPGNPWTMSEILTRAYHLYAAFLIAATTLPCDYRIALLVASLAAWTVSLYFAACMPRPPARREQHGSRWSWLATPSAA